MNEEIVWTLDGNILEGKQDDLRALLSLASESVESEEAGTLGWEMFVSEDGTKLHALERYADSKAALAHLGGFAKIAKDFMAMVEVTGFAVYGAASEELRAAIADWQPRYHAPFGGFRR